MSKQADSLILRMSRQSRPFFSKWPTFFSGCLRAGGPGLHCRKHQGIIPGGIPLHLSSLLQIVRCFFLLLRLRELRVMSGSQFSPLDKVDTSVPYPYPVSLFTKGHLNCRQGTPYCG